MFQQVLKLMCGRFGASPCSEMRWGRTEIWRNCKEDVYLKSELRNAGCPLFWIYSTVQRYWGILYCGIQKRRFLYVYFIYFLTFFLLQCTQNPRRLHKVICGPARLCWETFLHGLRAPPQWALLLVSQAMNHMRQEMQNPGNTIPRLPGQNVSFHCGSNWLMCPHPVTHIIYRWGEKKEKKFYRLSQPVSVYIWWLEVGEGCGGKLVAWGDRILLPWASSMSSIFMHSFSCLCLQIGCSL